MSSEFEFSVTNEGETERLAESVGHVIQIGDVICLEGPLGAGKTHFVRGVATANGSDLASVNSPTFGLIQEYGGRVPICHIDAYRLKDAAEFLDLGGDEILAGRQVFLIEWPSRIEGALPKDRLMVTISPTDPHKRVFTFVSTGKRSSELLERIRRGAAEAVSETAM